MEKVGGKQHGNGAHLLHTPCLEMRSTLSYFAPLCHAIVSLSNGQLPYAIFPSSSCEGGL